MIDAHCWWNGRYTALHRPDGDRWHPCIRLGAKPPPILPWAKVPPVCRGSVGYRYACERNTWLRSCPPDPVVLRYFGARPEVFAATLAYYEQRVRDFPNPC